MKRASLRSEASNATVKPTAACLLLVALLTCVFSLTYSGVFRVDDEHVLASRTQALALWGDLSFPQVYGNDRVRHLSTISTSEADRDVAIEPAQAVLTAPLYRLAEGLDFGGSQAGFTLNLFATVACGAIVFLIVSRLGYKHSTAAMCTLTFGLGTMAWPFAKTFYRDPLAMLMVALTFLGWARLTSGSGDNRRIDYLLVLAGIAGGLLSKQISAVVIPAILISGIYAALATGKRSASSRISVVVSLIALSILLLITLMLPTTGPFARYSLASYNAVLRRFSSAIQISTLPGLFGPFLSPAKSIFLFSPILLLALPGIGSGWRQNWRFNLAAVLTVFFLAAAQALYFGSEWAGTMLWGLRYMLPAMPLMSTLCAPVFDRVLHVGRRWNQAALLVLFATSVLVQLGGALVPWHIPYTRWASLGFDPYTPSAVWDARYSVIPIHLGELAKPVTWDTAWIRTSAIQPLVLILPVCALALAVLSAILLRSVLKGTLERRSTLLLSLAIAVTALVLPLAPGLALIREDPGAGGGHPEFKAMLAWIEREIEPSDLVLVDSYGTPLWHFMMNQWSTPVRWYSLPFEIPGTVGVPTHYGAAPSEAFLAVLQRYASEATRVWYLEAEQAPDFPLQREKSWLDRHFSLESEATFEGAAKVVASLYRAPP